MSEKRLIDANALGIGKAKPEVFVRPEYAWGWNAAIDAIEAAPTIDAAEVEKYNELREAFVDFVCSGIHNPAPYCKNRCEECIDAYGWCKTNACTGFNPDGERRSEDDR